jgi:hypothetical protein
MFFLFDMILALGKVAVIVSLEKIIQSSLMGDLAREKALLALFTSLAANRFYDSS